MTLLGLEQKKTLMGGQQEVIRLAAEPEITEVEPEFL